MQAAPAQFLRHLRTQAQRGTGQARHRLAATANHAQCRFDADGPLLAEARLEFRRQALGLSLDLGLAAGQQAQAGQAFGQAVGVAVQCQHRFKGCEGDLVDAQGSLERVFLDPGDQVLAANDDPCLRPAQQFVAAEGDDIGAISQGLAHRRFGGQAPAGKVEQAAAAEVFE